MSLIESATLAASLHKLNATLGASLALAVAAGATHLAVDLQHAREDIARAQDRLPTSTTPKTI